LKYWKPSVAVVGILLIPGILGLLLVGLPFFDRSLERRPWKRPISVGVFVLVFLALGFFGLQSRREDKKDPSVSAQLHKQHEAEEAFMKEQFEPEVVLAGAAASQPPPANAEGASLFVAQGCNACHGDAGVGGGIGPRLVGIGKKYDKRKIESLLRSPTPAMLTGGMPKVDLKQDDLVQLIEYLESLQ
jgi:mono/diheme cytochrome c family protein